MLLLLFFFCINVVRFCGLRHCLLCNGIQLWHLLSHCNTLYEKQLSKMVEVVHSEVQNAEVQNAIQLL